MQSNRGSAGETSPHNSPRRQDSPAALTPGNTSAASVSTVTAAMPPSGLAAMAIPENYPPRTQSTNLQQSTQAEPTVSNGGGKKKKRNRHRKRRNRRPSFLAPEDSDRPGSETTNRPPELPSRPVPDQPAERPPFYRGRNLSSTSLESEALLDHRDQPMMRPRRDSRLNPPFRSESYTRAGSFFAGVAEGLTPGGHRSSLRYQQHRSDTDGNEEDDEEAGLEVNDRTPLITTYQTSSPMRINYGMDARTPSHTSRPRRLSLETSSSRPAMSFKYGSAGGPDRDYDVNNPPSVPSSPKAGAADMGYDDAVVTGIEYPSGTRSPGVRRSSMDRLRDAVIDMEARAEGHSPRDEGSTPPSPGISAPEGLPRRRTIALPVEEDVCFPSELAEEYERRAARDEDVGERRRRRRREWPDLEVLEEWSREEKEDRSLEYRVKKISEPVLVGGRLRPQYAKWHREEEDAPYRFTYFNDDFQSTIHAQTISELVQPGGSFRELFIPDPPVLEETSSDEEEDLISLQEKGANHLPNYANHPPNLNNNGHELPGARGPGPGTPARSGLNSQRDSRLMSSQMDVRSDTDASFVHQTSGQPKQKRYGPRPTWWLDVLCPTDPEMRVMAKAFGIHALTAEDIMMQEAREKVELFRNYYFLNYRTFEQDPNSENYLQPVNMYVVVFRDGCLSFHFSQTPHPANVRRRIRQLRDYLILSSDWISYALIDDITDVFGPLIQSIENEVDDVDDTIMQMHALNDTTKDISGEKNYNSKKGDDGSSMTSIAPGDMLRRVGDCRKKVMGMYRLLNTKADVIKGFAKRCNEQWEVAPKSEIGLYLGDIQDHIMTMTSNLTHYETLLSRAHSNYLAQINILMNERQEQTADVLGKLTVLGTIVLPMNIICGMWGMNVKVPGQDINNLHWFWSITAGLVLFGVASFLIAKRVYRIV